MDEAERNLEDQATAQRALVRALQDPARHGDAVRQITLIETHISYVLLTGRYAYKIKKAVNFGFVDCSTLELRRRCCADELRLNRRLAAGFYVAVVAIRGTPDEPRLEDIEDIDRNGAGDPAGDGGAVIEYAVKMREFPQRALFDRCLARGELGASQIDSLADRIALFHASAAREPTAAHFGRPRQIWQLVAANFAEPGDGAPGRDAMQRLQCWSREQYERLQAFLARRRRDGFVRECHGDLHLGNIAWHDGRPLVFDCIDFNPLLRWIDVISEVAFVCMDLEERGRSDLARRFLSRYLEDSGDYAGLPALAFYRVYRALVRAKVAGLRAAQEEAPAAANELRVRAQYLAYAERSITAPTRRLIVMHGVSGSGKSVLAETLVEKLGAIRLRSDTERKRLRGLPALAHSRSPADAGIYDRSTTVATYRRLARLARQVLAAGYPVVIDAACLKRWQRDRFRRLADEIGVPLRLLSCRACDQTLRRRLVARAQAGNDASEADLAVLDRQLRSLDALSPEEETLTTFFDSENQSPDALPDSVFSAY